MDSLRRLEEIFAHFPGIGPRQARRFVYYLLNKSPASLKEFTDLVQEVKKGTSECDMCRRIFIHAKKPSNVCSICADPNRDHATLMVVARDSDYESIEKSGAYRGLYFILGGTVPILDKEPEKRIRLEKLLRRVSGSPAIREIILSLNTTPDGENTEHVVSVALRALPLNSNCKISILGRGLSTGAELEYVDGETIKNALQNRH
ncbi:MAG: toprim domain-containing protein [Patescibacteria group bacterium]|nr:toprim domain-containing protein [Patescibacteria group bacterium]MDE2172630.1 toprim domain-containing protein [Patescibacteria group bacterium]